MTADEALLAYRDFERKGEFLEAYDAVRSIAHDQPEDVRLAYAAVLAMARCGATDAAQRLYASSRLRERATSQERAMRIDIMALEARLAKDRARRYSGADRETALREAQSLYAAIADETRDPYPGVNAATLAMLAGDEAAATSYAQDALRELERQASSPDDYWRYAIAAEAALVLNDEQTVTESIAQAAQCTPVNLAARASTLGQLSTVAAARGIDAAILDPLRPPSSLYFHGVQFSQTDELATSLPSRIADYVGKRRAGFGYGSLAAGADILMAEALIEYGAALHVFLPFDAREFAEIAVRPYGESWMPRFRRCFECATSVRYATQDAFLGDDVLFSYAARYAMGTAILNARNLYGSAYELVVRETGANTSHPASDAGAWTGAGHATDVIAVTVGEAGGVPARARETPHRVLRAMIFADIFHFSRLSEAQLPQFNDEVLGAFANTLDRYRGSVGYANTWGDGIYAVFDDACAAAGCAIDLQADMHGLAGRGFPADMALRLGAHFGPVFPVTDPITKRQSFTGTHITRTARIEPITPEGAVYVTDAFAAELMLVPSAPYRCEYAGNLAAAKAYGAMRMYALSHL